MVSWGGLNPGAGTELGGFVGVDGSGGGNKGDEGGEFHFLIIYYINTN